MTPEFDTVLSRFSVAGDLTLETLKSDGWLLVDKTTRSSLVETKVQFDLASIDHIDSAGLAWLLNFKKDASLDSVVVSYTSAPEKLTQLAALSGVDHLLISK
ncbi:STAS domain-containing protein [Alteromonas sp. 5E99-2]|uniref:STAS domain-containing protein n=1 Tax=Alteromonas sp. 5E99-2 TaxID=2817683 RepID=UPI001A98BCFA|nr:STAS domain-containing protein [Alteromonas sp. 5E99-2]MBO1254289.1 STAS domain-containing protein [Alteromonas sp. 5E99-2]